MNHVNHDGTPPEHRKFIVQEALQHAPLGAFQSDCKGNCFFANKEWENMSGLTQAQSLGQGWLEIVPDEDKAKVMTVIAQACAAPGQVFSLNYRIVHPQKGDRRINLKCVAEEDQSYFTGYVQDVTEERLATELSMHLASLLTSMEDIVLELDANKRFTNIWVRDERILFMPKEQLIGKTVNEVFGPLAGLFTAPLDRVAGTGLPDEFEYQHIDPSVDQWFRARIAPVNAENPVYFRFVLKIQDITRQKKAALDLEETKRKLERSNLILDISQELSATGGWEYNLDTGAIYWTEETHKIMGVQHAQPTLERNLRYFEEEDQQKLIIYIRRAIDEHEPYTLEVKYYGEGQPMKWLRIIGQPVVKDGEVKLLRGAIMDITQKKRDEMELIDARDAAEAGARAQSEFLSIMSHEIRTPLNGIIGIANLLKLDHTPEQEAYITNLLFSADHLLQLVNDILDLNKIDSHHLELVYADVNIGNLLAGIRNQFLAQAREKGISLLVELDKQLPIVRTDEIRLGQILNNLLSNAVKFTDEGQVVITAKILSTENNRVNVRFAVKDTGPGIPQEFHTTIFERFRQVHQSVKRKHSGTGLGLAITRKLVALLNGRIVLDSLPGKGTTFYFDLPFDLSQAATGKTAEAFNLADYEKKLNGIRLLFVEDNPVNILVARNQLRYFGVEPDCAHSGAEALALLENNSYHIALIDLHMPEMDGFTLSDIVRVQYPDMHIVIFTADITSAVRTRFADIGIHDILNKPLLPREMLDMLLRTARRYNINLEKQAL